MLTIYSKNDRSALTIKDDVSGNTFVWDVLPLSASEITDLRAEKLTHCDDFTYHEDSKNGDEAPILAYHKQTGLVYDTNDHDLPDWTLNEFGLTQKAIEQVKRIGEKA